MGRVTAAGDNAAMESWHALLQKNVLDRLRRRTRDELHEAIVSGPSTPTTAVDANALGKLTPVEFELAFHPPGRSRCGMITTHPGSTDPAAVPPAG
jgi:putative transposase